MSDLSGKGDHPAVSVIIPTYNRAGMLGMTIESFIAQSYPKDKYEIIVSDNNSGDDTKKVVSDWQAGSPVPIHYLFEKRQGVHYARNSAAKIARGEILYFTDDDMVADKFLLEELVKVFALDPLIGSATGKIIGRFDVPPPGWVKRHLTNAYLSLTEEGKAEELVVSRDDLVYSCHEAVRRDVFFQCGGFNPENTAGVWIGDGETGLGIKMRDKGYKFAYTARSVIHHLIPETRTTLGYLIKRIGNQGYCDSYTEYRTHRRREKIPFAILRRSTIGLAGMMALTLLKVLYGKESWHFIPARIAYVCRRNRYDLKLYSDEKFRGLAEIDDWLENDRTMDVQLD